MGDERDNENQVNYFVHAACTTEDAKRYVSELIGDCEARAPGKDGKQGRPYFHYFLSMTEAEAAMEFYQVEQLPIQDRERDLLERMGLDGRA